MAVRRFRDHIIAHNWFAVGIDVAVVVLGVFLGLWPVAERPFLVPSRHD